MVKNIQLQWNWRGKHFNKERSYSLLLLFPQVDKEGDKHMFICCEEHIDIAIDMYVDKMEKAPNISLISVDKYEKLCDFCANKAVYIVGN